MCLLNIYRIELFPHHVDGWLWGESSCEWNAFYSDGPQLKKETPSPDEGVEWTKKGKKTLFS